MATDKHILVVEDDLVSRRLFTTALTNAGFRATAARDGREGVETLSRLIESGDRIDLVLTDIMMPKLSGLDLIDEMKRMGIDCPVFAVTAFGEKDVVVELLRRGCADFIEKPVDCKEMIDRIGAIFRSADQRTAEAEEEEDRYDRSEERGRRRAANGMRAEIDAAVTAYRNLTCFREADHPVDIGCFSRPLSGLGGDIFSIRSTGSRCDLLAADVSGHDMGAAFHAVLINTLFHENATAGHDGGAFFRNLNSRLLDHAEEERMATALFLRLDLAAGEGEAVCAGHPPFIRLEPSGRAASADDLRGDILGVFDTVVFRPLRFRFNPGDRFFLFTDGVVGAGRIQETGGARTALDAEGLRRLVARHRRLPIREMVDVVGRSVVRYGGYAMKDDILLAGIGVPAVESRTG